MSKMKNEDILNDPDFKTLVKQKNTISWILAVIELVIFFTFVYWVALDKPFLARKLSPDSAMTIGIPIAIGTILVSWVLTGIYIYWANTSYDTMVKNLKDKIGGK